MGEGVLPYDAFLSTLRSHRYDGWVCYEMCSPIRGGGSLDNLKDYARRFIEYMRRFDTNGPERGLAIDSSVHASS